MDNDNLLNDNEPLYVRIGKHTIGLTGTNKDDYILLRWPKSIEAELIRSLRERKNHNVN